MDRLKGPGRGSSSVVAALLWFLNAGTAWCGFGHGDVPAFTQFWPHIHPAPFNNTLPEESMNATCKIELPADRLFISICLRRSPKETPFSPVSETKRIAFLDTLIQSNRARTDWRSLAREIGHHKMRHAWKGFALGFCRRGPFSGSAGFCVVWRSLRRFGWTHPVHVGLAFLWGGFACSTWCCRCCSWPTPGRMNTRPIATPSTP